MLKETTNSHFKVLTKGTVSNLQIHNAKLNRPTFLIHTYKLAGNLCGFTFSQMQSVGIVFANRLVGVVTATVWFSNCIQCSSLEILSKQPNHCEHSKGSKINYKSQFMCVTKTWHRLWITWIVCVCVCIPEMPGDIKWMCTLCSIRFDVFPTFVICL